MSDFNKTFLMGRLVRNAETKTTAEGLFITSFSIATNTSRQQKDGTWANIPNFFDHTLYGNRAKALSPYLVQGQMVAIEGHLIQRRWEKDGKKHSRIENTIDDIKLISHPQNQQAKTNASGEQNAVNPEIPPLDSNSFSSPQNEIPPEEEFIEPVFQGDIF